MRALERSKFFLLPDARSDASVKLLRDGPLLLPAAALATRFKRHAPAAVALKIMRALPTHSTWTHRTNGSHKRVNPDHYVPHSFRTGNPEDSYIPN